jgi:hypothetical protein
MDRSHGIPAPVKGGEPSDAAVEAAAKAIYGDVSGLSDRIAWHGASEIQRQKMRRHARAALAAASLVDAPGDEIERLRASYEAKVADLAKETLRVSRMLRACDEGNGHRHPGSPYSPVGEAGLGWNAALEWVEAQVKP